MSLGHAELEIFTEAVLGRSIRFVRFARACGSSTVRAPKPLDKLPSPMIIMTSGLQTAPASATEHRSSTDQSTRDTQTILPVANVQVTGLL